MKNTKNTVSTEKRSKLYPVLGRTLSTTLIITCGPVSNRGPLTQIEIEFIDFHARKYYHTKAGPLAPSRGSKEKTIGSAGAGEEE